MRARTYDAMGNPEPRQDPYTPITKFGDGWAPAAFARTSIILAHPREHWLEALDHIARPPELLEE